MDIVVYSVKFAAAYADWRPWCTDAYEDVWVSISWDTPAQAAQSLLSNDSAVTLFSYLLLNLNHCHWNTGQLLKDFNGLARKSCAPHTVHFFIFGI